MYRIFSVNYLESSRSQQVKSCYVFASSVSEALALLPKEYVIKDIISSIKVDYHPLSPTGSAPL